MNIQSFNAVFPRELTEICIQLFTLTPALSPRERE